VNVTFIITFDEACGERSLIEMPRGREQESYSPKLIEASAQRPIDAEPLQVSGLTRHGLEGRRAEPSTSCHESVSETISVECLIKMAGAFSRPTDAVRRSIRSSKRSASNRRSPSIGVSSCVKIACSRCVLHPCSSRWHTICFIYKRAKVMPR